MSKNSTLLSSDSKNTYQKNWDNFYSDTDDEVFWDSIPDEKDIEFVWCVEYFNKNLPVLDLGCGSGLRTQFLRSKFDRVIGVDVSNSAIEIARNRLGSQTDIKFEVLDATDVVAGQALYQQEGDVNIYMRGVWHAISTDEDKQNFSQTLKTLIGDQGVLILNELDHKSLATWKKIFELEGGPPSGFQKVMRHQIKPGDIDEDQVAKFFSGYSIVSERASLKYTYRLTKGKLSGEFAEVPSFLMRITKK